MTPGGPVVGVVGFTTTPPFAPLRHRLFGYTGHALRVNQVASGNRLHLHVLQDDEVRARYGQDAAISRKGRFVLVHLDSPGDEVVRRRTEAFDPDVWFEADCPLCQIQRAAGVCVFDGYPDEEEWILLD